MNSLNPRKPYASFLAGLAVALSVAACGGGGGGGGDPDPDVVKLSEPDDLMAALDDKVTSNGSPLEQVVGTPPATNALTPKIEDIPDATAQPGSTVSLPINLSGDQDLSALFAKIPGASSYFQANIAPSEGKTRTVVTQGKETVSFVFLTTVDFKVEVPDNIETGGRFCIEVEFRETGSNVGEPVQACVDVVGGAPQQPANDQPSNADFGSTLLGTWATNCFDIDSGDGTSDFKGAKLLLGFSSGKVYSESVALYDTSTCTGQASTSPFIDGVWNAGNAVFDEQARRWQRPFDFNPNDPDPSLDFEPCYNVLSLNSEATQLYLGLPSAFSFDSGQAPVPGDCSAEDLRPASVILGLPFTKQ